LNHFNLPLSPFPTKAFHNPVPDLISDPPENSDLLILISVKCGGVLETSVDESLATRKERAGLFRMVTNRNNIVNIHAEKLIDVLGAMRRNINP